MRFDTSALFKTLFSTRFFGTTEYTVLIFGDNSASIGCAGSFTAIRASLAATGNSYDKAMTINSRMLEATVNELVKDDTAYIDIEPLADNNSIELTTDCRYAILPLSWYHGEDLFISLSQGMENKAGHLISARDLNRAKQVPDILRNSKNKLIKVAHLCTNGEQLLINNVAHERGENTPNGDVDILVKYLDNVLRLGRNLNWLVKFTDNYSPVSFECDNLTVYIMPYLGRNV